MRVTVWTVFGHFGVFRGFPDYAGENVIQSTGFIVDGRLDFLVIGSSGL